MDNKLNDIKVRSIESESPSNNKVHLVSLMDKQVGMSDEDYQQYRIQTLYRIAFEKDLKFNESEKLSFIERAIGFLKKEKPIEGEINPMAAWICLEISKRNGWSIPDWVQNYIDQCIINITRLDESSNKSLAIALKMDKKKGGATIAKQIDRITFRINVAHKFFILARKGTTYQSTVSQLAKEFGCGETTIRTAWRDYRSTLGWPAEKEKTQQKQ